MLSQVEIPGFEPGQREPKSLVLPLHHTSIPRCKDMYFFGHIRQFSFSGMSKQSVDQVPDEETGEFAYEQQDHCPSRTGLVES